MYFIYGDIAYTFALMAQEPLVGQGCIIEASRSHSGTPRSVGLLSTSDQTRRRELYLTTHNTHKRKTFMPPVEFETAVPACQRPHTHTLDRGVNGICGDMCYFINQSWKNEIELATA